MQDTNRLHEADPATPARSLPFHGASNFRDFGGYRTAGGSLVRWRTLFRSDHLAALAPQDVSRLRELGIARSLDFRGRAESVSTSYEWPHITRHALPIEPVIVQRIREMLGAGQSPDVEHMAGFMRETYVQFALECDAQYGAMFGQLLNEPQPVVLHCTAGKDRTGFGVALILLALGVPRATVMQDYLLTNQLYRLPEHEGDGLVSREALEVLWRVRPRFLEVALEAIDAQRGGLDRYLQDGLGVGPAQREELARLYLEPGAG